MTEEKILDKLGKIKAHMESAQEIGNEAEAQAFAAMLQNLLMKHKLEMTDIQYSQHVKEEPVGEYGIGSDDGYQSYEYRDKKRYYKAYPDVEVVGRRIEWTENLAGVIARAHSCQSMICPGRSAIWFVGQKSNVKIVEYLYITMLRAADKICHKEYMKFRRQLRQEAMKEGLPSGTYLNETHGFKQSFLDGFISRLMARFEEEKRKIEHDHSGAALMRIDKEALAVRSYLDQKQKNNKECKPAKAIKGQRAGNTEGYRRGKAFADGLRIDANAVEGGAPNKQLK